MMALTPTTIDSSQGLTFSFNSVEFRAKSVKVKKSVQTIDVSDCSLADASTRKYQVAPLKDGDVISLEFWGLVDPPRDAAYAISCTKLGITGNAICTEYEKSASAGELTSGTASFQVTG
jgi:hypothetical protein